MRSATTVCYLESLSGWFKVQIFPGSCPQSCGCYLGAKGFGHVQAEMAPRGLLVVPVVPSLGPFGCFARTVRSQRWTVESSCKTQT